ncbi:MAG TPA: pyridoxamine 5'-phosphate oxidase family protein [Gemmatimonadaceae bacterium]|jgi:nitroimidazol reductase NimA-like FMN-containing flavoprotein (pyridoxamine 5'-phosphate oxidase superfamily)
MEKSSVVVRGAGPEFRELSNPESMALLERNSVGRIAFSFRDSVDVRPIHYVLDDGWLFGRTSAGDKLITLRHNQWVAFEVDEISGPLDWQSVVVRGSFYVLKREGSTHDVRLYDRAADAIRRLSPDAFTNRDPLAFRTEVFGVSIDSISGRSCSTRE